MTDSEELTLMSAPDTLFKYSTGEKRFIFHCPTLNLLLKKIG